jgi:hypothetical protein
VSNELDTASTQCVNSRLNVDNLPLQQYVQRRLHHHAWDQLNPDAVGVNKNPRDVVA